MTQILIYVDQGVDGGALKQLIASLRREVDLRHHCLCRVDAKKLIHENWEKEAKLLIIPGGRDIFFHAALAGLGTDKIRAFVERGGNYLGICAGAYFACDRIEFEKGGALEVSDSRSLKFFSGVAKGPAYGNNRYSYQTAQGAEAAHVSWDVGSSHIYFNGGCFFEADEPISDKIVLSRYLDLVQQPAAILHLPIGKGCAVLSGVHFEYQPSSFFFQDPFLLKISPLLWRAEEGRRKILREILRFHDIQLKN